MEERSRILKSFFLVLGLSTAAFLFGGAWTYLLSENGGKDYRSLQFFTKVYDLVKKQYVEEPKDDSLVEGAIRGMVDSLPDAHSQWMSKEEFAEMQSDTKGQFGGLGIEIARKNGMLTVVSPIEDTPAFKKGIKSGDVIVKIGNLTTEKLSIYDAVKKMRGKAGEEIEIWVRREGVENLLKFNIERAIIKVKSVSVKDVENFPVIKVRQFVENTADEVRKALENATEKSGKKIPGLVLDLRNNPGGLLQQAVEVADFFIEKGLIVYTQGRDKTQTDEKRAVVKGTEPNYPLVVLINGGSASASEIVAGALQDQEPPRAWVMGTQSFGKGSVQNVIPLEDGSGLKLTVALYYTPKGRTIQGVGIKPNQIVETLEDSGMMLREKDLPGHIVGQNETQDESDKQNEKKSKSIKDANAKKDAAYAKLSPLEKEDFQLAKAIEYLKNRVGKK